MRKELDFNLKSYLANNKLLTESIQENKEIDSDLLELVEEEINSMRDEEFNYNEIKLNYKLFIENKLYSKGLSQIKKLTNENPSLNYDIIEILHENFYSLRDEEYSIKDIINAYNQVLYNQRINKTELNQSNKEDVDKFCEEHNLTKEQFYGKKKISGMLNLRGVKTLPSGFSPVVDGSIDLSTLKSIPDGFNPKVGVSLSLDSIKSIPQGFNPKVPWLLNLRSLESIPNGFNPKVGVVLILSKKFKGENLSFSNVEHIVYR